MCGKKVNNASRFNLRRNFAFVCTLSLSPRVITWARDMVTWYWSAGTLFWQLSINYNTDVQYQRCTYGNGATLSFLKVWGWAYWRTDSHVTTQIFEIDGLPNFLRYGAPLARLRHAGAPPQTLSQKVIQHQY